MALLGFPNPVNEVAARCVAAQVVTFAALTLVLGTAVDSGWLWLTVALAVGFLLRVLAGPTLSPFGRLAVHVLAPAIGHERLVAGPPKRFAQAMGLTMSTLAVVLQACGAHTGVLVVLALLIAAATLEAAFGLCIGCRLFALGMRLGLVPEQTCLECADISGRLARAA